MLIVKDEIVEDPHHRGDDGVCPSSWIDMLAGPSRCVTLKTPPDFGYLMQGDHKRHAGHQGARAPNPLDGTSSRSSDGRFPVSASSPMLYRVQFENRGPAGARPIADPRARLVPRT